MVYIFKQTLFLIHEMCGLKFLLQFSLHIFSIQKLFWAYVIYEFSQSQMGKATIENAQLFQLAMKLARFSNNNEEKQGFQEKAGKLWKFLTNATGLLDPVSFQVSLIHTTYFSVSNRSPGHSYYFSTFLSQEVLIKNRTAIVFSQISDKKQRKYENIRKMVKLHAKYNVKKLKIVEILLPGSLFKEGCLLDF